MPLSSGGRLPLQVLNSNYQILVTYRATVESCSSPCTPTYRSASVHISAISFGVATQPRAVDIAEATDTTNAEEEDRPAPYQYARVPGTT